MTTTPAEQSAAMLTETPITDAVCTEIQLTEDGYPKQTYDALCKLTKLCRKFERELQSLRSGERQAVLPGDGSSEDFGEMADLVVKVGHAKTNGDALGLIADYRFKVRQQVIAQMTSPPASVRHGMEMAAEPIAWLHSKSGRVDVAHKRIKEIWDAVDKKHLEHYTIPLFTGAAWFNEALQVAAGICEQNAADCDVIIAKNLAAGDKKAAEEIKREKSAHLQDAQRIRAAAANLPEGGDYVMVPNADAQHVVSTYHIVRNCICTKCESARNSMLAAAPEKGGSNE